MVPSLLTISQFQRDWNKDEDVEVLCVKGTVKDWVVGKVATEPRQNEHGWWYQVDEVFSDGTRARLRKEGGSDWFWERQTPAEIKTYRGNR